MPAVSSVVIGLKTIVHLFFTCPYSSLVQGQVMRKKCVVRSPRGFSQELAWMDQNKKGNGTAQPLYRLSLAATLYHIWRERIQSFSGQVKSGVCFLENPW